MSVGGGEVIGFWTGVAAISGTALAVCSALVGVSVVYLRLFLRSENSALRDHFDTKITAVKDHVDTKIQEVRNMVVDARTAGLQARIRELERNGQRRPPGKMDPDA